MPDSRKENDLRSMQSISEPADTTGKVFLTKDNLFRKETRKK